MVERMFYVLVYAWTAVNLGPRALNHHRWHKMQFVDYILLAGKPWFPS